MTLIRRLSFVIALAVACAASAADQSASAPLRYDPFARPAVLSKPGTPRVAEAGDAATPTPAPLQWRPDLRGTLVGGKLSLVNIGGTPVAVGEEIDGYRLVSVQERQAIFIRDGAEIAVSMDDEPQRPEDD